MERRRDECEPEDVLPKTPAFGTERFIVRIVILAAVLAATIVGVRVLRGRGIADLPEPVRRVVGKAGEITGRIQDRVSPADAPERTEG